MRRKQQSWARRGRYAAPPMGDISCTHPPAHCPPACRMATLHDAHPPSTHRHPPLCLLGAHLLISSTFPEHLTDSRAKPGTESPQARSPPSCPPRGCRRSLHLEHGTRWQKGTWTEPQGAAAPTPGVNSAKPPSEVGVYCSRSSGRGQDNGRRPQRATRAQRPKARLGPAPLWKA